MDEFLDEKNIFLSFSKGYKAALSNELIEKGPDRNQDLGYSFENDIAQANGKELKLPLIKLRNEDQKASIHLPRSNP